MKNNITISNWDKLPVALDLHTVALIFGVTEATIKTWIYNGNIEGCKIGRKWIFDKRYIQTVIEKRCNNNEASGNKNDSIRIAQ